MAYDDRKARLGPSVDAKPPEGEEPAKNEGFVGDGCTLAPDLDLVDCCLEHDRSYESGAVTRFAADLAFAGCIRKKRPWLAHIPIAFAYWLAVRIGGLLWWRRARRRKAPP